MFRLLFHLLLLLVSLGVCQSGGVIAILIGGIFLLGASLALLLDLASLFA